MQTILDSADQPAHDAFVEKKSEFIGDACHIDSLDEALAFVQTIRDQHPKARHVAYAAVCGGSDGRLAERMSDDGEPSGTAGKPILDVLRANEMTDCVVAVTRYFGGILLGTGGLTRAYTRGAKDALDAPNGGKFWKLLDLTLIGFEKDTTFPGFSHGTAGTAWMFAVIYKATKNEKYLELAKEGAKYLQGIAVGDENAVLIPYQDHPVTGPTNDKFYLSTCHGPAGHTLLFRILYEITGEQEYLDWFKRISRGTIRAGAPERFSWGFWNAQCQCCGTAGILEHFVHAYEFTKDEEFLEYAKRTAKVLLSDSSVSDEAPNQRKWYGAWTRTIPDKVVSYAGLYVGSAGCASALLSLYATDHRIRLTQLFEYAHFATI